MRRHLIISSPLVPLSAILVVWLASCSFPTDSQNGSTTAGFESREDVIFHLGIQRGKLEEKQVLYKKAIAELTQRRQHLQNNFESMTPSELHAFQEVHRLLTETYKLTEVAPAQSAFDFVAKARAYGDKTKIAMKYFEESTPIFTEMIRNLDAMSQVHDSLVTMLSDLGAIFPFVRNWIILQDQIIQASISMKISAINTALFTAAAGYVRHGHPIELSSWHMGAIGDTPLPLGGIESYWRLNPNLSAWFTVKEFRDVLMKGLNITTLPSPKWSCNYCSSRMNHLTNSDEIKSFLERHAEDIYILIDEVRLAYGPESFPIALGPIKNLTEVGDSRVWRKPKVLATVDAELAQMNALLLVNEQAIEFLNGAKAVLGNN